MDGIAVKPLTVSFHEGGFLGKVNGENKAPFWFQLDGRGRQQVGSPWGPANAQALNRYSYVQNNPLKWTDPTGHERRCNTVGCAGKVYNNSSQSVVISGDRRIEGCSGNGDECFEYVSVVLGPGESSLDYGFTDVDRISAVDADHPLAGRGPEWRYKIGDWTTATIVDDGNGGTGIELQAPNIAWWLGEVGEWDKKNIPDVVSRPKCKWVTKQDNSDFESVSTATECSRE